LKEGSQVQQHGGFEYGVKHFLSPEENLLSSTLQSCLDLSLKDSSELIQLGSIYINGKRVLKDLNLAENTYIRAHTKPRRYKFPKSTELLILKEEKDFLIINKPSGIPVHPTVDNFEENLIYFLQNKLNTPLYITHRLDVPTSGLIVFAKTQSFQQYFNTQLSLGRVEKKYSAITLPSITGVLSSQTFPITLQHWMEKSPKAPKILHNCNFSDSLSCELQIESIQTLKLNSSQEINTFFELQIRLITGRTHQIRAQLSFLNSPILNDQMYGAPILNESESKFISDWLKIEPLGEFIALRCNEISFEDPIHKNKLLFSI